MAGSILHQVATIPGDGVGQEVVAAGRAVVDALLAQVEEDVNINWVEFPWGSAYYDSTGRMMAEDGLDKLRSFDAIYFGAVGWPTVPDHVTLWGLRLAICQGLDQWANVRPVRMLPGVPGPLRTTVNGSLEWVVVRENSEGEYSGIGGRNFGSRGIHGEIAVQSSVFTEHGCERIIRFAFDLARARALPKVTSVTKSNAQQYGLVLWDEVFTWVSEDYPDVESESALVDAMAARFVLNPQSLSVVVASNLFADILSDLGSALTGSLGLAASANLDPDRRGPSMFEPVHGSAPDIAGKGVANPIGAILSAGMMLDHLGHPQLAARLSSAVDATTLEGHLPPDLGGEASTAEIVHRVVSNLST